MAEEDREAEIGAAGMVDRDEGGVGDKVEALLAAVVRARPPADVGEQAGGVAVAALRDGLGQAGRRDEAVGPGAQLLAVRRARANAGC